MTLQVTAEEEIIITEYFAVTVERAARDYLAAVSDVQSPYNEVYALGSITRPAIAARMAKIRSMRPR